ncbi:MAG: efflux RND transporter permease subunit [Niabella sp.]|nr:MAG: efflux RND transporter permease subunit [Niabella sp.]
MFKKLVAWSTIHKWKTVSASVLLSLFGVYATTAMDIDVLPNINKPTVAIFAEVDGLAPEEIEKLVLVPIENAVLGTPGVDRVRGVASFGLGIVNSEFAFGSDIYKNRQLIQERLSQISLPENVHVSLGPISSIMGEIMWVGVTGENQSNTDLRSYADFTLRPSILKLKGVSDVIVMGGDVLEWQIRLNADALRRLNLKHEDINALISKNLQNTSGGLLVQQNKEYPIRVFVAPESFESLKNLPLQTEMGMVRLGEIASFVKGASQVRGTASIDGKSGIVLRVFKQPNAETLTLTGLVDDLVQDLSKSAPEGLSMSSDLFKQEWFISAGLKNVEEALRDAFIIVAVIVFLFLMRWRPTFIALLSIPVSICITAIIFYLMGLSVNVMTLGGIAVAIGELVDGAIVSVENIIKRLRNRKEGGLDRLHVIISAVKEVFDSIVYATVLVALVFIPVFFLPGVEGKLLSSLGLAYIVSLIASLIVALTLTPALAAILFNKEDNEDHTPKIIHVIEEKTERILLWLFDKWKKVATALLLMIVATVLMYSFAGKEGIPQFNEDSLTIGILLPTGTDLETTNLYAQSVGDAMKSLPFVSRVSHTAGRAAADPHGSGSNSGEMQVVLKEGSAEKINEYIPEIQEVLNKFSGATYSVGKPISHRVEELLSGVRAPIVIKLYGDDIEGLRSYGDKIVGILREQEGVANPQLSRDVKVPEIHIYPDTDLLATLGTSAGELGEEIQGGFIGNKVGEVVDGLKRISVVTRLDNESKNSFSGLRDTTFPQIGDSISSVAAVGFSEGRTTISHEGGKRTVVVSANYEGGDIVGTVERVKQELEESVKPENITVSFEGTYQSQKENSTRLAILFSVVILVICYLLYQAFNSWILAMLIITNIPVAFFGGLVFVYLYGGTINLAHLVGFISLAGIVSRNGIMLISRTREIAKEHDAPLDTHMILLATKERVVPVLMTSIVTTLALIPLIVGGDAPGKEFLSPLAIVMTGGLITSTITSILFTPVLLNRLKKYL